MARCSASQPWPDLTLDAVKPERRSPATMTKGTRGRRRRRIPTKAIGVGSEVEASHPKSSIVIEPTPLMPIPTEMFVALPGMAGVTQIACVHEGATASLAD